MKTILNIFGFGIFALGIFLLYSQHLVADETGAPGSTSTVNPDRHPKTVNAEAAGSKFIYVCPMDGYKSEKPGQCPKCGMDLEKQKIKMKRAEGNNAQMRSGMDMSGNKFRSFDAVKFGVGKNAKICPVSGDKIKPGEGVEATLSNGKKIMMCCPNCKRPIEKDLKKYEDLMYD